MVFATHELTRRGGASSAGTCGKIAARSTLKKREETNDYATEAFIYPHTGRPGFFALQQRRAGGKYFLSLRAPRPGPGNQNDSRKCGARSSFDDGRNARHAGESGNDYAGFSVCTDFLPGCLSIPHVQQSLSALFHRAVSGTRVHRIRPAAIRRPLRNSRHRGERLSPPWRRATEGKSFAVAIKYIRGAAGRRGVVSQRHAAGGGSIFPGYIGDGARAADHFANEDRRERPGIRKIDSNRRIRCGGAAGGYGRGETLAGPASGNRRRTSPPA